MYQITWHTAGQQKLKRYFSKTHTHSFSPPPMKNMLHVTSEKYKTPWLAMMAYPYNPRSGRQTRSSQPF